MQAPGAPGHYVRDHCSRFSIRHSNLDSPLHLSPALSPFLSPPFHIHQGAGSRTVARNHPWVSTCPLAVRGIPRLPHPFCTLFAIEWLHLAGEWAFQWHHITGSPRGNISGELTRWTGSWYIQKGMKQWMGKVEFLETRNGPSLQQMTYLCLHTRSLSPSQCSGWWPAEWAGERWSAHWPASCDS